MFARTSRYADVPTRTMGADDGSSVTYVAAMRRVPQARAAGSTRVVAGDRPDLIAWRAVGDPTQFWRIADVNASLDPRLLAQVPGDVVALPARD